MPAVSGIKAGKAFILITAVDRTARVLARAGARLRAFGAQVTAVGVKLAAIGAVGLVGLVLATRTFAKTGDELEKMARRTGFSVEALSTLGFAAEQSGTSITVMEKAIKRMQKNVRDAELGLTTALFAFEALGFTFEEFRKLSPEEQFKKVADGLAGIEDMSRRAGVAQDIFGRAGTALLPMLEDGAAGVKELQEEARKLGLEIGTKQAKQAAALTDAWNRVRRTFKMIIFNIGGALAPLMEILAERVKNVTSLISKWIAKNKGLVIAVATAFAGITVLGIALIALSVAIKVVGFALTILAVGILTVKALVLFLLSPIGLLVAAFALAGIALFTFSETFRKTIGKISSFVSTRFKEMGETISNAFGGIVDALSLGEFETAFKIAVSGVRVLWLQFVDFLLDIWDNFASGFIETFEGAVLVVKTIFFELEKSIFGIIGKVIAGIIRLANEFGIDLGISAETVEAIGKGVDRAFDAKLEAIKAESAAAIEKDSKERKKRNKEREDELRGQKSLFDKLVTDTKERARVAKETEEQVDIPPPTMPGLLPIPALIQAAGPLRGLERGSVEALEQFQKNVRDSNTELKRIVVLEEKSLEVLDQIRNQIGDAPVLNIA